MKCVVNIIASLLVYGQLGAQLEIIPTNTVKYLTQLSVIDSNIVVTGREDYMVKSADECNSMTLCILPGPSGYQNYLSRVDPSLQYLLSSSFPSYNNKIYKSVDGGLNWSLKIDTTGLILQHIIFFDSLEGIAFGTYGSTSVLLRTKDGGNGWTSSMVSSLPGIFTTVNLFGDSTICVGLANGASGPFYMSSDRGNTWSGGYGFSNSHPKDFYFLNKDTIFGVASFGTPSPGHPCSYLTRTYNGGATWENIGINDDKYLGITFKNYREGYIVGINNVNEGIILKTTDMGETWKTHNTYIKSQLAKIEFLNDTLALVCGSGGVLFKLNTNTAIFTGIFENSFGQSNLRIYPNPIKDILKIEFVNLLSNNLNLSITNTVGQIVYRKDNVNVSQGLDISFLESGIYYLKLENRKQSGVFKIIKE